MYLCIRVIVSSCQTISCASLDNQDHGNHVARNHVGRFTRTDCTGTSVQVHGLHHCENTAIFLVALS